MNTDEHLRSPVTRDAFVASWRVLIIFLSFFVSAPAFILGVSLADGVDRPRLLQGLLIAGAVLGPLAAAVAAVAVRLRLSTYATNSQTFGRWGGALVNLVLAMSLFGWFGVVLRAFGEAAHGIAVSLFDFAPSAPALLILGGITCLLVVLYGFRMLNRASLVFAPFKAGLVVLWGLASINVGGLLPHLTRPGKAQLAASAAIGAIAVAVTVIPDVCRYARSTRGASLAAGAAFGLMFPAIIAITAAPTGLIGSPSLSGASAALGFGVAGMAAILVATMLTNCLNLYSGALVTSMVITGWPYRRLAVAAACLGVAIALLEQWWDFRGFLNLLSVAVPGIPAIYATRFLVLRAPIAPTLPRIRPGPFFAWLAAVAVASEATWGPLFLSGVPALDGALTGALVSVWPRLLAAMPAKAH